MATVARIKQEFLDLYNEQVAKHNSAPESERPYYFYEAEEAVSFIDAFSGTGEIEGLFEQIDFIDGVTLPSGKVKRVKQWGDGDGDITFVFSVGEQFFQIEGWYSSWDGYEWRDNLIEVEPKEVTVVRFFPKK